MLWGSFVSLHNYIRKMLLCVLMAGNLFYGGGNEASYLSWKEIAYGGKGLNNEGRKWVCGGPPQINV